MPFIIIEFHLSKLIINQLQTQLNLCCTPHTIKIIALSTTPITNPFKSRTILYSDTDFY